MKSKNKYKITMRNRLLLLGLGLIVASCVVAYVYLQGSNPNSPGQAWEPVEGFIPSIPEAVPMRHEHHMRRIKSGEPIQVAFFGDSLARGWEDHEELWDRVFGKRKTALLATTNDTTSNLLWRIGHEEADGYQARLVIILIGINNRKYHSADETVKGIETVVDQLRKKQPKAKILLLGLLPQGRLPTDHGRKFVANVNDKLKNLDDKETVFFRDHGPAFLEFDGQLNQTVSMDGTHFTVLGYERWAKVMEKDLKTLLNE